VLKDREHVEPRGVADSALNLVGRRTLLLDAVAIGLLRRELVRTCGPASARAILTQFGFAHGFRTAGALQNAGGIRDLAELHAALGQVLAVECLFHLRDGESPLAEHGATLDSSFEAEQHLLHFGRADTPACWTVAGLVAGYLSRVVGSEIVVLEDRCVAKGDENCRLVGRTRQAWDDAQGETKGHMARGIDRTWMDVPMAPVIDSVKAVEERLQHPRNRPESLFSAPAQTADVTARSIQMVHLHDLAHRVAKVDATVLITGESGTGKERIAQRIHDMSPRAHGPFVAVNCGAVTETLLESELFGHGRGAFTGATRDRIGLFEAADGGTLLLDEIGEVSAGMQVKLLRALEQREIRRVGENRTRPINVRVLAATNRDLRSAISAGTFREDLYYRLKVVELHVPALRERRGDVIPLARALLSEIATRMQRSMAGIAPKAAERLVAYPWPGNVRELENALERAVALARGTLVELEDLPEEVRDPRFISKLMTSGTRTLEEVEKDYILAVLRENGGNQTRTAQLLHIGSATLYRKLKSYHAAEDLTVEPACVVPSLQPIS
jgi:two-component system response regulator HydG